MALPAAERWWPAGAHPPVWKGAASRRRRKHGPRHRRRQCWQPLGRPPIPEEPVRDELIVPLQHSLDLPSQQENTSSSSLFRRLLLGLSWCRGGLEEVEPEPVSPGTEDNAEAAATPTPVGRTSTETSQSITSSTSSFEEGVSADSSTSSLTLTEVFGSAKAQSAAAALQDQFAERESGLLDQLSVLESARQSSENTIASLAETVALLTGESHGSQQQLRQAEERLCEAEARLKGLEDRAEAAAVCRLDPIAPAEDQNRPAAAAGRSATQATWCSFRSCCQGLLLRLRFSHRPPIAVTDEEAAACRESMEQFLQCEAYRRHVREAIEAKLKLIQPPMRILPVPGDGNCQFSGVLALLGPKVAQVLCQDHTALRAKVVEHLRGHTETFEPFLVDTTADEYLAKLAEADEFGDMISMQAIANLGRLHITLMNPDGADTPVMCSGQPVHAIFLAYTPRRGDVPEHFDAVVPA